MTGNDKMLIEELEKRLVWYREEATDKEFDAEEVDAICTMLQKLSPIKEPHRTKEEAFENIMEQIRLEGGGFWESEDIGGKPDESGRDKTAEKDPDGGDKEGIREKRPDENDRKKSRRALLRKGSMRVAIVFLVVFGGVFSLDRVTYARENKSLFTMILESVGVLEIEKEKGTDSLEFDIGKTEGKFYDSWTELDFEVKEKIIIPEYIPEGFYLYGVRYWEYSNKALLKANYYDQSSGHMLIEITLWEDNEDHYRETVKEEDESSLIAEKSDKNTLYYEVDDEYICLTFKSNGVYRISGNIALKEMTKIREGLE